MIALHVMGRTYGARPSSFLAGLTELERVQVDSVAWQIGTAEEDQRRRLEEQRARMRAGARRR